MSKKKEEIKQMVCVFQEDGSTRQIYDADIIDEPFMGIVYNTINELAEIWFDFVKDAEEAKEKVKKFGIIIKI